MGTCSHGYSRGFYWVNVGDGEQRVTVKFIDEESQLNFLVSLGNAVEMEVNLDKL